MLRGSAAASHTKTAPTSEIQKKTIYLSYETSNQKRSHPRPKENGTATVDHQSPDLGLSSKLDGDNQRPLTITNHGSRRFLKNGLETPEEGHTTNNITALKGFRIKPEHIQKPMDR